MDLNLNKVSDFEDFEAVCGLEIHVQLKTKTKLFCSCPREFTNIPNLNICPICVGLPGVLPYPNRQAVVLAVRASLLLNMKINRKSFFERKNYFYPDLPKNYQISQYRIPLAEDGFLEIEVNGNKKKIGIQRLHMEEDAGKMIHGEGLSYVDFSRSGTPLIEIVTKPDISSPDEAYAFLTKLHKLLVWCDVTEGSMEEGNLRCDVNVSVKPRGMQILGTKVEIKNVNSFRFIKEAIDYEIKRQISVIKSGGKIEQETRGYDSIQKKTFTMRSKEYAHDYRYFPEPDILPLYISDDIIEDAKSGIPELPDDMKKRFINDYGLSQYAADVLTSDKKIALLFEDLAKDFEDKKLVSSFVLEEVMRAINDGICDINKDEDRRLLLDYSREVLKSIVDGVITRNAGKEAFREAILKKENISEAIGKRKKDLSENLVESAVLQVLQENPKEVERYKSGEKKLIGFFIGEVMKKLDKKADPKVVKSIIEKKLES
jgi:aspartyl-tRNA(Asn)/glutamyl-tRNA(Gln) amidotransferase subunit B